MQHRVTLKGIGLLYLSLVRLAQGAEPIVPNEPLTPNSPPAAAPTAPQAEGTPAVAPAAQQAKAEDEKPEATSVELVKVEEAPKESEPPPPPPKPRNESGVHYHDGLYVRLGLGGGFLDVHGGASVADESVKYTVTGNGPVLDIMIGGAPLPGLVVGGGYWFAEATSPKVKILGETIDDGSATYFGVLGPFIDVFPDPRGGFHFGGMLGVADVAVDADNSSTSNGVGGGAFVGYDAWISEQWSLGGELRGAIGSTSYTSDGITNTLDPKSIELMLTALYQ